MFYTSLNAWIFTCGGVVTIVNAERENMLEISLGFSRQHFIVLLKETPCKYPPPNTDNTWKYGKVLSLLKKKKHNQTT